jgi:hypothetical protein
MYREKTGMKKVLLACLFFVILAYNYKDNFEQVESDPNTIINQQEVNPVKTEFVGGGMIAPQDSLEELSLNQ